VLQYPLNTLDFHDIFSTEEACREYLIHLRWPEGFRCPHCNSTRAWQRADGQFRCSGCRRTISVTSGTIFAQSHQPLRLWFQAIWDVVSQKHGVSALGLQHSLGFKSHATTWDMLRKLRKAMVRPDRDRLTGLVEVDETIIGGIRHGKPGRTRGSKVLVLVAVEDKGKQGIGRIRLSVIQDAFADTLEKSLSSMVSLESTLRTDGWRGYQRLSSKGYGHTVIKQRETDPGEDTTPLVHRVASLLKRWLLSTHQGGVHPEYLQEYLNEFTFRFNRRRSRSRGLLFYRLLGIALQTRPTPTIGREQRKQ